METRSLLELYRTMVEIREFELRVSRLTTEGKIPGFVHLSLGQEASAVGACAPLTPSDVITSTHRGHGHCIAKGLDMTSMFAELMGRSSGTCAGLGGSMHIADPGIGIFGANGIVAAGLPIASGAALASRIRQQSRIVVAFFGDGAAAQGAFHESVNLAALWRLPVIFFCENNHYAEFSRAETQHPVPLSTRAAGYGIDFHQVHGNDVAAVYQLMTDLAARARRGEGPFMVEAETYRWHGHYEGDPERYRTTEEVEEWKARDPLLIARERLLATGAAAEQLAEIDSDIRQRIDQAVATASAATEPDPAATDLSHFMLAPRPAYPDPQPPAEGEIFRTMDAVHDALEEELSADPSVFVAGIDVGQGGNVFALTRGLAERWPTRVIDTPISETAIMGLAVGSAMAGLRPVVELMYLDFIGVCLDQLLNQAAKMHFMTGGKAGLGLTIRTQFAAGRSSGSQHSQSLEVMLAHIPGLTVVMPATPWETYGLLRAAIQDPNPVIFIENRLLYGRKGIRPPRDLIIPLGKARVARPGQQVTVVSYSAILGTVLTAAEELAAEGIDTEVIDLRTIQPLDRATILTSLAKTNRMVVVHEAVRDYGVGAEVIALCAEEGFWHLDAPLRRVAARFSPAPYAPSLERVWLPSADEIKEAIRSTALA
ncbi:MAG: alpha-ketoacid dehydrogenase subunit alpha/beta [Streptosporangiaceae bacterium]